jgi:hypothetical protein
MASIFVYKMRRFAAKGWKEDGQCCGKLREYARGVIREIVWFFFGASVT